MAPARVEAHLRTHLQTNGYEDVEVHRQAALNPARTSPDAAIVRVARAAVQDVYGVAPIVYPLMPASGPMYDVCDRQGTPAVNFGAGYPGDNVHGVDENVRIADYFEAMKCFGEIMTRFAEER